jgi:AraC-like DNA-binding protein
MSRAEISNRVVDYLKENIRVFNSYALCSRVGISPSLLTRILNGDRRMTWKTTEKFRQVFQEMKIDVLS